VPVSPDQLRQVVGLQHASDEDLSLVLGNSVTRAVEESSYFFMQGDTADYFFILTSGQVKLLQSNLRGQNVLLRTIYPWQMFGALGITRPNATYPVSAQAMTDSAALAIESALFRGLAQTRPHLAVDILGLMTTYVQEMQGRYRELATERVEQRVASTLLRLASQLGEPARDPARIDLVFSRQDLAEMTGTTLFTVSRLLSEWDRRGIVQTGRERIRIMSPHELVRIAEGSGSNTAQIE
jgi:CRP-like cAMP-binding protein